MAQTNYTPISLYYSTTATNVPTAGNLVAGELAINTADGKLFYKDSSNVVQVLATKSTGSIGGSNTQVQFNNSGSLGGSSGLTWDGSFLTTSSIKNSALTSGRVTYAGASGLLSDSANLTFDGNTLSLTNNASATSYYMKRTSATAREWAMGIDGDGAFRLTDANSGTVILSSSPGAITTLTAAGDLAFKASSTEKMRLTSTGLGIGTSSPSCLLEINQAATSFPGFKISGSNSPGMQIVETSGVTAHFVNDAGGTYFGTTTSHPLIFRTVNTERMRIESSGNVIINASSTIGTGGKFQVTSNLDTSIFKCTANTTYAAIVSNVEDIAARLMAFQYGSGSSPTNVGSITTNGTITSYNISSDYRLKENIVPMTGALATVAKLKPVTYKWKSNGADGQGFIAHELAEVVSDCVTGEKDAVDENGKPIYQGIDTSHLVATLVSAIQEQQALIESLTTRLTALENK